jgi:hypothetical protein
VFICLVVHANLPPELSPTLLRTWSSAGGPSGPSSGASNPPRSKGRGSPDSPPPVHFRLTLPADYPTEPTLALAFVVYPWRPYLHSLRIPRA